MPTDVPVRGTDALAADVLRALPKQEKKSLVSEHMRTVLLASLPGGWENAKHSLREKEDFTPCLFFLHCFFHINNFTVLKCLEHLCSRHQALFKQILKCKLQNTAEATVTYIHSSAYDKYTSAKQSLFCKLPQKTRCFYAIFVSVVPHRQFSVCVRSCSLTLLACAGGERMQHSRAISSTELAHFRVH